MERPATVYSWVIGVESQIVAACDAFTLPTSLPPKQIIEEFEGTSTTENGNRINGRRMDILTATTRRPTRT